MVPKDFGGPNGFLRDAQGFLEVPTVLLLRYRYCSKSPVFLSSEYTSTFRFVFRPTASCERMRSCVSLWATAASRPHTEKCPGFIGGACVFCLVLWPIDREPRAPSRKVPQAAEYHKPSRRVPIVGPRFLKVPTAFSEMPEVFEGANAFIITLSLLQQGPSSFIVIVVIVIVVIVVIVIVTTIVVVMLSLSLLF